jgi:hypothetical protein
MRNKKNAKLWVFFLLSPSLTLFAPTIKRKSKGLALLKNTFKALKH